MPRNKLVYNTCIYQIQVSICTPIRLVLSSVAKMPVNCSSNVIGVTGRGTPLLLSWRESSFSSLHPRDSR